MGILAWLQANPAIVGLVITAALWWVRQSPTPNPMILSLLEMVAKFFKVPLMSADVAAKLAHSHDLKTTDGLCCAVNCLCDELERTGQKTLAESLTGVLPLLLNTRRKSESH